MKRNLLLLLMSAVILFFTSCSKDDDSADVADLKKQVEELKALLDSQTTITDVSFEGSEMVLTFSNGAVVKTEAPTTVIPYIGDNGNWWVNGKDLGTKAEAEMPSIGHNGNWWIDDTDTGVKAQGANGQDGTNGKDGVDGTNGTNGKDGVDGTDGTGIATVEYDPSTAILTIVLTDGTKFEYVLFNEDGVQGNKIGDLNGKYLLKGITNGDMPFADFVYNQLNQLTDITYFTSVFNAAVKNYSLHRTFNADNKLESQAVTEFATIEKAVPVGWYFPNEKSGIKLSPQEAFDELFPTGLTYYSKTPEEFFSDYKTLVNKRLIRGQYLYDIERNHYWNGEEELFELFIRKFLIRKDDSKKFGFSEINNQKCIWTSYFRDWKYEHEGVIAWGDYYPSTSCFNSEDIEIDSNGNFNLSGSEVEYDFYNYCHLLVKDNSSSVDEKDGNRLKDYITVNNSEVEYFEEVTDSYKFLLREYDVYKPGDEIQRATFAYSYDGEDQTGRYDGQDVYTIKVVDDKIDQVVYYNNEETIELLKLNYTNSQLTSISSPYYEADDVVKMIYDAEGNPTEYQVNSKDLAGKGMDEALARLGLAYMSEVYDEDLGRVVERYTFPDKYTPLLKVKYDYTMKNFMNHSVTAVNPLFAVFNQQNAFRELIWAGHGSCFIADYLDFNEGGYPTKFKGYLQMSPFEDELGELPVNGAIATTYKLSYQKIEE